ncbi:MAG TPA: M3 family peptidase, partial [Phenylobacterium sp.]|nr:M3 family peptidase [Phenylobacterium sp.]
MFMVASTAALGAATLPLPALAATGAPLLAPWTGPYGGVPAFDKVQVAEFAPALEAAMAEELREVAAIADNRAAPTFDNTIAALERSGQALDRVTTYYGIWGGTLSTPEMRAVETAMAPKLAA